MNLYGAGRLICADSQAMAASRVMGTCLATGHAAGVAAAIQGEAETKRAGRGAAENQESAAKNRGSETEVKQA